VVKVAAGQGAFDMLESLRANPVIPAVRGPDEDLDLALSGDHPAVFMLGGDVFKLTEKLEGWTRRPPVVVNVDLVGGVAGDAVGVAFLARHVEGIISTNRHVIELGTSAGLVTIQRLFALDLGTIERGIRLVKRAKPKYVEVLPALAYPLMASRHPEVHRWHVLAGGLLKSEEEVSFVLRAGAAGVSTSHRPLWKGA
jgi:glycerol uptake operon antiterminator